MVYWSKLFFDVLRNFWELNGRLYQNFVFHLRLYKRIVKTRFE